MHKLTRTAATAAAGVAMAVALTGAGAVVTVATASAAAASETGAQGWDVSGSFDTQQECVTAGDAGLADGSWAQYRCVLFEARWDLMTPA
ncbi:hypothetical protein OG887_03280 [Streptomyces sp. NBC_00053]|uniref:hypothetical protein n=1 Tax=unclassified Streptomyces TaxID=2593676 RepID=UPI00225B2724|nr:MULTISPECIES: hypothetical protein [unclassified Streptomyces]MCX5498430.1 hypothetical protein [Streptomyces sp. NBC_00052]MCX5553038.1 hypothetical protein [Streptomyces sp. NBC_00051]